METLQTTKEEVLQFVEENGVKFIRLVFCDLFGMQKNISIMSEELETAFSEGISFDASAILGFSGVEQSDLFLKPDPKTISLLPWRPQQGRVARFYCTIVKPNGEVYESDSRTILKKAIKRCTDLGYGCKIGGECEFYLFKTDEFGDPTKEPFDKGGYFDMAPLDKGENVRREICLALEEMGLQPEASHHEQGPGQNEIDFRFSDAISSADNFMSFKTTVKAISARNGLFASFMPKPLAQKPGNGMHINISLYKAGKNLFLNDGENTKEAAYFMAGILSKSREIALFLNPIPNSYERLGEFEAPTFITWSRQNRSQLIRIPAASRDRFRMELRSPDPSLNPYLAYALIIEAGLYGIENKLQLQAPSDYDLYLDNKIEKPLEQLPRDIKEAIKAAKTSEFVKQVIGSEQHRKYIMQKEKEASQYDHVANREALCSKYFNYI